MDKVKEQLRTARQNRALHHFCEELAVELNNAGVSMRLLMENFDIDHTKDSVKMIWKAVAKQKWGKESTTQLTSKQITEVYDEINRAVVGFGIHLAFPSAEWIALEELERNGKIN